MLRRSWQFEIALGLRQLRTAGQYGLAGLALFPGVNSGVQFEVNVSNRGRRNVQVETQWFEAGSGTWNNVSGTGWVPHASSVYRLHVFRPFNASRWVVTLTGINGFECLAEAAAVLVEVLNRITILGLRVNSGDGGV